jgi:hypothetical protein
MEEQSASVHGFTETEETIYDHILQDVHCYLYRRRSKDVLHQVTVNVITMCITDLWFYLYRAYREIDMNLKE